MLGCFNSSTRIIRGMQSSKEDASIAKESIRILLSITAHFNYEIWQMDIKTAFLNINLEEEIYMKQSEGFIAKDQEHMVCKLKMSIYGLKQASRSWIIRFDQAIKSFGFEQNLDEACV